jgi:DNA-binding MarR family transcriptional regulator
MNGNEQPSLGFLLIDAARILRRRIERASRDMPMTTAQLQIVWRLKLRDGMTQAELASLLDIDPMTLSRHLDRMEAAGLVERRACPKDRRARRVVVTDKARALVEPMRAGALAIYEEAQAGLSPEARAGLIDGLRAIIANLSAADAAEDTEVECRNAAGAKS